MEIVEMLDQFYGYKLIVPKNKDGHKSHWVKASFSSNENYSQIQIKISSLLLSNLGITEKDKIIILINESNPSEWILSKSKDNEGFPLYLPKIKRSMNGTYPYMKITSRDKGVFNFINYPFECSEVDFEMFDEYIKLTMPVKQQSADICHIGISWK